MTAKTLMAEELTGQHIGRVAEFRWQWPVSMVQATVMGELREVHHDAGDYVVLLLTGSETGDKTEFEIKRGQQVALT